MRFYLGRNEMLSDAKTLRDADRAYLSSEKLQISHHFTTNIRFIYI